MKHRRRMLTILQELACSGQSKHPQGIDTDRFRTGAGGGTALAGTVTLYLVFSRSDPKLVAFQLFSGLFGPTSAHIN